jgi:hypothetical protein
MKRKASTRMHGSSVIVTVDILGCPPSLCFIQLVDELPLNVKCMVSRHLLVSTHRSCNQPVTWLTLTSFNELYSRGFYTTNQYGYITKGYACLVRSCSDITFTCYINIGTYIMYSITWTYQVHNKKFQRPIHHKKHYIIDLLKQCMTHINKWLWVCFIELNSHNLPCLSIIILLLLHDCHCHQLPLE